MMDEPAAGPLKDGFGRRIDYLRVSVTDRCDLRCAYCLPKDFKGFETPANWLTHDEMTRLVGLFVGLGVSKVRLTGGEPLLRRGIAALAGAIAAMPGLADLSVSTNGTQLARHAQSLRAAGVDRLNVSLDTLDAAAFGQITGRDCLSSVLAGLDAARRAGFAPIKLNSVVHAATPGAEVRRLLDYAVAQGFVLRLIEPMPMGECGRGHTHVDLNAMGARLAAEAGLLPALAGQGAGPARYWTTGRGTPVLGVITPMSRHFCASCNRVRLGVDGTLYLCLGQEDQVPLGRLLREGASDAELTGAILAGIAAKPERHEFTTRPERIVRFMAQTGG
ncbi:GTP 3',8-cyclase MoaA [Achromobacter denitrificans]|uniref:GTP 3',8-cyclase MoaA n=1 Tax=Achromobacter denitrificans TaxID=32002 RepID=UPI0014657983|nr:GTP 3',8-cyclase MoaA [Achromobacter denitrificans]CAB3857438.1 GTP 3',8-cyclase 2 [Achromobacter denitrificans]